MTLSFQLQGVFAGMFCSRGESQHGCTGWRPSNTSPKVTLNKQVIMTNNLTNNSWTSKFLCQIFFWLLLWIILGVNLYTPLLCFRVEGCCFVQESSSWCTWQLFIVLATSNSSVQLESAGSTKSQACNPSSGRSGERTWHALVAASPTQLYPPA